MAILMKKGKGGGTKTYIEWLDAWSFLANNPLILNRSLSLSSTQVNKLARLN